MEKCIQFSYEKMYTILLWKMYTIFIWKNVYNLLGKNVYNFLMENYSFISLKIAAPYSSMKHSVKAMYKLLYPQICCNKRDSISLWKNVCNIV